MKEKLHQLMQNIKKDLIFLANEVEHSLRLSMKALDYCCTKDEQRSRTHWRPCSEYCQYRHSACR